MKKLNENGWFNCEKEFYNYIIGLQERTGIGYGRMMQILNRHWQLQDPIGTLRVGQCIVWYTDDKKNEEKEE